MSPPATRRRLAGRAPRGAALRGALGIVAALLASTATADLVLEPGQSVSFAGGRASVGSPAGWVVERGRWSVTMSRDGVPLNAIEARFHEARPGERSLERRARSGEAWIEEFAAGYLARLTRSGGLREIEVTELSAATLAGRPAFRLGLSYVPEGRMAPVRYGEVAVGTWIPGGLLVVRYAAPLIHYFPQHLDDFEATLPLLVAHGRRK